MENRKFYSLEGVFHDLRDDFRAFLKRRGYYYELSACGDGWHFEVKLSPREADDVNVWLDDWYAAHDCITEVRA